MTSEAATEADDERTLREYAVIIWKRRRVVGLCALALGILGLAFGLIRSRKYESTAVISPPRQSSGGFLGRLASTSPEIMALAGSMLGEGGSTKMYTDILSLRQIRESLAEKHGLVEVYDVESKYFAARKLEKRSKHKVTRGGLVEIMVADIDPERAAALANGYVKELNNLLGHLNVTQASLERNFLEKRLVTARRDLSAAEEALRDFQQKNKAVGLQATAEAGIDIYAQLKARLMAQETRLNVVKTYKAPLAPEVQILEAEVKALRKQLAALEAPRRYEADPGTGTERPEPGEALVHLDEVPEIFLKHARLLRDFKIQEKLFEFLTMQLEAARIQEAKDAPVCQVVQRAEPSEKPSGFGPKRLAVLGILAGLVLGAVAAIVIEDSHRAPDTREGAAVAGRE